MLSILQKFRKLPASREGEHPAYAAYERSRHLADKAHLCHAPFNNMYFNVHGQVGPCWLTLNDGDTWPEKSVRDIWFGERFRRIREKVAARDLGAFCKTCKMNIESGNYVSVLAKLYDLPYGLTEYPTEMEFELSNRCNLECVMCKGELSSSIREKREGLPPIPQRYDDRFVEQLREFIPHLKEAKFLGGEPFLIDIYTDIWEVIRELNPGMRITVTTNGTALNNRIKQLIEDLDFQIIISIDSFKKETYEQIRIKAVYEVVMKHLDYFLDYAERKNKVIQVSINPLRKNWHELHEYVDFCNARNMFLWFNTVVYPHEEALWSLPAAELEKIHAFLQAQRLSPRPPSTLRANYDHNCRVFENLVNVQLVTWLEEARRREARRLDAGKGADGLLRAEIAGYFDSDAYLVPGVRRQKTDFFTARLDMLRDAAPHRYEEICAALYQKPFDDILTLLRTLDAQELLATLSEPD